MVSGLSETKRTCTRAFVIKFLDIAGKLGVTIYSMEAGVSISINTDESC